jgi:hypothetical protein
MGFFKAKINKEDMPIEGNATAYDKAMALTDDQLKDNFMGINPLDVPREVQEELYKRFVGTQAQTCSQCYGRGHTGWNDILHQLQPCMCLQRVIRDEEAKENQKIILMN